MFLQHQHYNSYTTKVSPFTNTNIKKPSINSNFDTTQPRPHEKRSRPNLPLKRHTQKTRTSQDRFPSNTHRIGNVRASIRRHLGGPLSSPLINRDDFPTRALKAVNHVQTIIYKAPWSQDASPIPSLCS